MFKDNYNLSSVLLQSLTQCERLYGQLEALKLTKEIQLNLERDNKIRSSYISNSIEGNPLSLPEVTNLLLGDRVPANRDEKEVYNYFQILKNLYKYKKIDLQTILQVHKNLLQGVNADIAGLIRNKPIVVGKYIEKNGKLDIDIKHNPPTHKKGKIEKMLTELIHWLNTVDAPAILKAGIFHHQFVYIHPFEDGNGRTCRLLTALILIRGGYHINKYFVLDDYYDIDRPGYSDALNSADKGDKTKWLEYFTVGMKYSLQSALSRSTSALSKVNFSQRPSKREIDVLELVKQYKECTSSDVSKELEISRQQAHSLLKSLVKKGYLEKKGSTKSSYYIFK